MNITPFLSVNHSCEEALKRTKRQLLQAGLHSMQTFDLHDGSCMHHGTGAYDCQMGSCWYMEKLQNLSLSSSVAAISRPGFPLRIIHFKEMTQI